MFIEVNGTRLYYEKRGEGRPLILLHGNGEDHTIFQQALLLLEKRFCCYAVDSRCHGQSGGGALHYTDMAADMLCFMEELDLRDVIFYGFSDGGIIGLLAAPRTDRISTLIVSGANLTPMGIRLWERLKIYAEYLFRKDPKLALMIYEPCISDDVLAGIRADTLVLAGSSDVICERETRHIADVIPGAELQILDGEDHESYIVHSEKIAKLIIDYCRTSR
ncbi:MAG: alpha/beta hydrolase [Oscillospiraceae bacterium]|nr:alpha/beta hydrolase [Oscillospiraceae bacterium]